jgi:hypothetical protein
VSIASLLLTLISVVLLVYLSFFRKPKLQVRFYYVPQLLLPDPNREPNYPTLRVINRGPGEIRVERVKVRIRPAFCWLFGNQTLITVTPLRYNEIPYPLGVTDVMAVDLPANDCVLDRNPLQIGAEDWFGRKHWAPKKDLEEAQRNYARFKKFLAEASPPRTNETRALPRTALHLQLSKPRIFDPRYVLGSLHL